MIPEPVHLPLDEAHLARVDALARFYRVERDVMLARLLLTGILAIEKQVRAAQQRGDGGAS